MQGERKDCRGISRISLLSSFPFLGPVRTVLSSSPHPRPVRLVVPAGVGKTDQLPVAVEQTAMVLAEFEYSPMSHDLRRIKACTGARPKGPPQVKWSAVMFGKMEDQNGRAAAQAGKVVTRLRQVDVLVGQGMAWVSKQPESPAKKPESS